MTLQKPISKIPKYPKLTCEQSKRTKICIADRKKVRRLVKNGKTQREVAVIFGVNQTTIWHIIHPKKWKLRRLKNAEYIRKRCKTDPKFKKKHNNQIVKNIVNRSKNDSRFRNFMTDLNRYYYQRKRS